MTAKAKLNRLMALVQTGVMTEEQLEEAKKILDLPQAA